MLATTEPFDTTWLDRLAGVVTDGVVAAVPTTVHPARPRSRATPYDGRVRAAGLSIDVTPSGVPVVRAADAGAAVAVGRPPREVPAASAACVLIDRAAYEKAGGLPEAEDLDVAVIELCLRLREPGGRVVVEPSTLVFDHRPVRSRRELVEPVDPDSAAWSGAIERSGSALLRSARPLPEGLLRIAITIAAPFAAGVELWGDWHLAEGLGAALRRLGHDVRVQTIDRVDEPGSRTCDVHVVLRGLKPVARSAGQRHVLWVISHPELIEDGELETADLVLAASPRYAHDVRSRVTTPVEVLLQATDQHRFFPRPVDERHRHPVTVVARTRAVLRPAVADALTVGIRPSIYGDGWAELVDPQLVVAEHVDNELLPVVYSSAGVVLNDHWRTMQSWGFVSNRIYDVLACGTPVISDPVDGLDELFDGAALAYHDPDELKDLVAEVLADPETARARAERGREAVLARHTFDHRAVELVALVRRHARPF
jgi:glycosyltransferase involved in cell wall biosynthesis